MHLDTMLTMAGYGVFTKYAGMGMLSSYTVEPGATASELSTGSRWERSPPYRVACCLPRPNAMPVR